MITYMVKVRGGLWSTLQLIKQRVVLNDLKWLRISLYFFSDFNYCLICVNVCVNALSGLLLNVIVVCAITIKDLYSIDIILNIDVR